ncbi:MAG: signal recognition particle-docking protein FtsY [Candidatus Micrarchaeota archaeon]|nr:signal recognition particle-docking protein FtsY [Candidatus Micrarchaeota archaeon]
MFGILKKKITGLVNSITKSISKDKEETVQPSESPSISKEKVKAESVRDETVQNKEKMPEEHRLVLKSEEKSGLKVSAEMKSEKETEKKDMFENQEKLVESYKREEKTEETKRREELKEAEIKVKTSLITKVKSVISPEVTIKEEDVKSALEDFEMQLLTADVALPVAEEIIGNLRKKLVGTKVKSSEIERHVLNSIYESIAEIIDQEQIDLIGEIQKHVKEKGKPYSILFVGPNGAGKTTTIAKVAFYLKKNGLRCVISASDTFRAAAIEQTIEHAKKLEMPYIKHDYGSDPAAVAFDAIRYAEAKKLDVVLIDSAGRQETNRNLIEQLKKIERVVSPNKKVFVGEGITGNALLAQVSEFNEAVKLDGVILTKLDIDAKGGTIISVKKATGVPILFIGVGQEYNDLIPFDKEYVVKRIMSENT